MTWGADREIEAVVYCKEDRSISRGNAYKSSVPVAAMSSGTVALRILVLTNITDLYLRSAGYLKDEH